MEPSRCRTGSHRDVLRIRERHATARLDTLASRLPQRRKPTSLRRGVRLAARGWAGAVQRAHHVDGHRVVYDLSTAPDSIATTPDSAASRTIRIWVALDLLLMGLRMHTTRFRLGSKAVVS